MGKIFYLIGPSASGKDRLLGDLKARFPQLRTIVMYTTRPIRSGEEAWGRIACLGPMNMTGYDGDPALTARTMAEGYVISGDIGYLDDDGFLFLTGRKKNLIILSDGENVSPEKLEAGIGRIEGVAEAMVYEDNNAISVQIYPDDEHMGQQAWFEEKIRIFNEAIPPTQRIKTVKLRTTEFPKSTSKKILRQQK